MELTSLQNIKSIVDLLADYPVSEINVQHGDLRIMVRKADNQEVAKIIITEDANGSPAVSGGREAADSEPASVEQTPTEIKEPLIVTAPMVGVFSFKNPAIRIGDDLSTGDVLGTIESLKILNDVISLDSGRIAEILILEGTPVEFGQPLIRLDR